MPTSYKTYDYGLTKQGEEFIVMELIDGHGPQFLDRNTQSPLEQSRIDLLLQITDGLEFLHQQGFLHRDMCPRNIMVTKENVAKLIDFGLSIPNTFEFCRPGNRTGTPNYLAPSSSNALKPTCASICLPWASPLTKSLRPIYPGKHPFGANAA